MAQNRIGIFGGTFNPVHNGHLKVVRQALAEHALDRLIVIPAAQNPLKDGAPEALPCDRLLLLRAAFNGMSGVTVDDRELRRGGVSYAIDTVREIAAENPGAEILFFVGADSVPDLPRWKDADELQKLCRFVSYPRTAESSTEIRARLARGESVDDLVPATVALFLRHGVRYNGGDAAADKVAAAVLKGLERKEGFCPCRIPKLPEFFCPCDEFKGQLADVGYHGLCHCRLYVKP